MFDLIELDAELADLLRSLAVRFEDRARVFSLTLGARNLIAGRILIALQTFELGNQTPAPVLQRGELFELAVNRETAAFQAALHLVLVVADVRRVKHAEIVSDTIVAVKSRVRKVVFPAAGLGTRFLPATKAQPKEMLPLVDKPIIQYGVEEAVQSGVDNIIIVTGRAKNAIEDHFDVNIELESYLQQRGKTDLLDEIRKISNMINVAYVRQGEPLGLGHAVLVTAELIGDEPFAVILADDVIDAAPPALKQMIEVFERVGGPVLAVERVPPDQVSSYGIVDVDASVTLGKGIYAVKDLIEKPAREEAPSNLAIIGRYLLTPDIFPALRETASDRTGEIQLTNGLRKLLRQRKIFACEIEGVRHDTGNKLGYLRAMVYFALRRPDLNEAFREYLRSENIERRAAVRD
jgi:UTP--glucose-1-phosphate uridylyltransferase